MNNTRIASTIPTSTAIVYFFGIVIIGLVVLYMYLLSMSVVHVVFRKEVMQSIRATESEIAKLETAYIQAQHVISERIASANQFSETNEKIFVTKRPMTLVLSNN
jgi:hypothetical protein